MSRFPMTAAQASLFSPRFSASVLGVAPMFDGSGVIVPDEFDGTAQAIIAEGLTPRAADLSNYAGLKRFEKETGGIVVGGVAVATDRQSQAMISGAYSMALGDPSFSTQWKTEAGSFVPLDAPTIIAIARAVGGHVAACFAKEAEVAAGIVAGTVKTYADINAAFAAI